MSLHSSTTLLCLSTTGPTGSICKFYNFDKKHLGWVQRQITALLAWRIYPGVKTSVTPDERDEVDAGDVVEGVGADGLATGSSIPNE